MSEVEIASGATRINKPARSAKPSPTIYDIGKVAGVNPSTVSRALSKPGRVSVKTRKLVEDAAAQLGYQVNPFARALPTGRTSTLGLIVADITNPIYLDIVRGTESTALGQDYTLMLADSAETTQTELTAARRMMPFVDGLILVSPCMDDTRIHELAGEKPLVVINREVNDVTCVVPEVNKGIGEAIRSLVVNGHRKIGYVAGPPQSWMSKRHWDGVQAACDWSKLESVRLESDRPTVDGGRRVAREVVSSGATAVLTYNDILAIGLMQELQAASVVVPDEISIVGFDDMFGADFTTPPLTTVRSPMLTCGKEAARLVLNLLNGEVHSTPILHVDTELVLRGSSGRLSSGRLLT
ncbi:LacI family DNA-binding transcriptional regulator [Pseudarthrobacter oxydans]|uniref:LacI family DNA-binding transcriptional regulator n=1 Tax=Pseudarthrobacter oxydans TaxID=1671 RepID=UPI003D2756A0